ncbi:antitoxin [Dactylosporangium sp. NPDC051541]|uniref:antitoxin n=1 Tax=Dactylosporangium sp. NPDC051541 TaxID=3363977 RepID=UPI0037B09BEE
MNSFFDKVKDLADQHDEKVDQALDKVGDVVDDKTGNKYSDHIDKGVDFAQEHTGEGDTARPA